MIFELTIQSRQRERPVNIRLLRRIVTTLLTDLLELKNTELGITLVTAREMTRLNKAFLHHKGSTDVITFDYRQPGPRTADFGTEVQGEIFVCVDEAVAQARRFRATWQSEIVRYIIHGVLHLLGHDDHHAADRRKMKREENRRLRTLAAQFPLSRVARKNTLRE